MFVIMADFDFTASVSVLILCIVPHCHTAYCGVANKAEAVIKVYFKSKRDAGKTACQKE